MTTVRAVLSRLQALLTRVAKSSQGAVELLRCGLVAQLIECQVFDMVPDSDVHRYEQGLLLHLTE